MATLGAWNDRKCKYVIVFIKMRLEYSLYIIGLKWASLDSVELKSSSVFKWIFSLHVGIGGRFCNSTEVGAIWKYQAFDCDHPPDRLMSLDYPEFFTYFPCVGAISNEIGLAVLDSRNNDCKCHWWACSYQWSLWWMSLTKGTCPFYRHTITASVPHRHNHHCAEMFIVNNHGLRDSVSWFWPNWFCLKKSRASVHQPNTVLLI